MKTIKAVFIFLIFLCTAAAAQVNDAGLWLSLCADKKITKKITLDFSHELRFNENISELGTSFTELGAQYKISKKIAVSAYYRFIQRRQLNDFYLARHRSFIDISYRRKIKKIAVTLRQRLQGQLDAIKTEDDGGLPEYYMRTKFTAKLDMDKKYTPYIAGEIFYPVFAGMNTEVDNYRLSAGVEYELNKRHSFTLSYIINREVNVSNPWTEYISGIAYKFSF